MQRELHTSNLDTSEAYTLKYKVLKELFENGQISQMPKEFTLEPVQNTASDDEVFDVNGEPIGYTPIKESQGWKLLTEHLGMYGGSGGITSTGFD